MKVSVVTSRGVVVRESLLNEGEHRMFHEGEIVSHKKTHAMVVRGEVSGWWYLTTKYTVSGGVLPPHKTDQSHWYLCPDIEIEKLIT